MTNNILSLGNIGEWLKRLNDIPKKKVRKETLLDIAGIDHLENHWSFIYMYFFNPKASHGLSRLFIGTLLEIICEKTDKPALSMSSFSLLREDAVPDEQGNMKRIDILIKNDYEAIIIENKVYANLYNRLDLYWRKPNVPDKNKRGVVLSLRRTTPTHPGFINITHEEFAHAIEKKLPAYFTNANPKALILLQDFIQNIYNVTHTMNEEEFDFYFNKENQEVINRLHDIRKHVISHIYETIEDTRLLEQKFAENNWKLSVKTKAKETDNYVYYTFDAMPNRLMLTLVYDRLWSDPNDCCIRMFLEIGGRETIQIVEKNSNILKGMGISADGHKQEKTWWHYKGYKINFSKDELKHKDIIIEKIIEGIRQSGFYEDGLKIVETLKDKF
ncbi:MAG: PD-(D/E)XK nuclease family protein [Prevotella sp.]|nr:PD-(D/E)XK nuclease family protein [Prevotella sp.]